MTCTFTARRAAPGRGLRKGGVMRIVVCFDDETFDQIRARAVRKNTSFAEQVRQLVEFGLIDAESAA